MDNSSYKEDQTYKRYYGGDTQPCFQEGVDFIWSIVGAGLRMLAVAIYLLYVLISTVATFAWLAVSDSFTLFLGFVVFFAVLPLGTIYLFRKIVYYGL